METLWYKAHAFTAAPVKNYLFALADDDSVLVYDDVARRYTTCHRLTAAEQDEIRAAFARREALEAQLAECNRRISEIMPRELTQAQVDGFMLDAPSMDAAIRAAYAAGWNAGRERLEHEDSDE